MEQLNYKRIFVFWLPLAATWLMMAVEGPFLAAIIARLSEPKYNLAAYGVAFAFALIIEAPVIMMLSAATALVKNWQSYLKLKRFTIALNIIIFLIQLIVVIPVVFYFITRTLMGLPEPVISLTHIALIIMLPWPAAIGFRRFYQGILIRNDRTRRVAYGTIIRLTSMTLTAVVLYVFFDVNGAYVGAAALSVAVTVEALASRGMVHSILKNLYKHRDDPVDEDTTLNYRKIISFYYPLALTSLLGLVVHPLVTFFLGQSRFAVESLAVLPVINSLVFIFRAIGLSYQEVSIAFLAERRQYLIPLRNFAIFLALSISGMLALIAFSPLAKIWFHDISGLTMELTAFALLPAQILALIPASTVILSFQRSMLVNRQHTPPITRATAMEVIMIVIFLMITIHLFDLIGATGAAIALIIGRLCSVSYLFLVVRNIRT